MSQHSEHSHLIRRYRSLLAAVAVAALWVGDLRSQPAADLLLVGGFVHDGSGQPPGRQDVGVVGQRITTPTTARRGDSACARQRSFRDTGGCRDRRAGRPVHSPDIADRRDRP